MQFKVQTVRTMLKRSAPLLRAVEAAARAWGDRTGDCVSERDALDKAIEKRRRQIHNKIDSLGAELSMLQGLAASVAPIRSTDYYNRLTAVGPINKRADPILIEACEDGHGLYFVIDRGMCPRCFERDPDWFQKNRWNPGEPFNG